MIIPVRPGPTSRSAIQVANDQVVLNEYQIFKFLIHCTKTLTIIFWYIGFCWNLKLNRI